MWSTVFHLMAIASVSVGVRAEWEVTSSCPRFCPKENEPVCGSDGVIYTNQCDLLRRNCGFDVLPVDDQLCTRSKGSQCHNKCNQDRDLACGSDGRTYVNSCVLKVESCRRGIRLAHMGPCLNTSLAIEERCPTDCGAAGRDGPICASNGNVYESTCQMKLLTCGQGVVKTTDKHCQTTNHCREICWKASKAVCASDGHIYASSCQMRVKNCGRHVFEIPITNCIPQERATSKCPSDCKDVQSDPVCGSDGNIYHSLCELQLFNCGPNSGKVVPVDWLRCAARSSRCSRVTCSDSYLNNPDYVCGSDGRTYPSLCHMKKASCTRGIELAHVGPCMKLTADADCPQSCDEEQQNDTVICGSDGNVYRSTCEMKRRTCGQHVIAVPLHHCSASKSCAQPGSPQPCDRRVQSACGSDGKIYRNLCEMRTKNCGKFVYEVPMSRCLALAGFRFTGCNRICPYEYDPVCGTDKKTYSNECFLQLENCRSRSLVTKKHHGKCGEAVPEAKAYLY